MRVTHGEALLVAVEINKRSPTVGQRVGIMGSAAHHKARARFARGFCLLLEFA